jgi:hypothetical protein
LLESLALIGILATKEHPGMVSAFTTYRERDWRPNVRVEAQAPLARWDSSCGLRQDVFDKVFGHLRLHTADCSGERPPAEPPFVETATGALARRRPPRQTISKTPPEAGKDPAQTGDVYAVRVRDGAWVTVFCHEVGTRGKNDMAYVLCEYLSGVFPEMPAAENLNLRFQGRKDRRWQHWTSAMDGTPWVRRIARGVPAPKTDKPAPDRIPNGGASSLKRLADWCFDELNG